MSYLAIPIGLALAEATGTYQDIITALQSSLTSTNITSVIVAGLTASVTFVLLWFGVRKVVRIFMAGFRKGKVST